MIVNQSDECNCDVTWYTPIELLKHLESTFYDDNSDANYRPWLHKITACYLKEYYRHFFPNPWKNNGSLGTHFIHVYKPSEGKLKKRMLLALMNYNEYKLNFNKTKIDINFCNELKKMVSCDNFPHISNVQPQLLVKSVTYNNKLKKNT